LAAKWKKAMKNPKNFRIDGPPIKKYFDNRDPEMDTGIKAINDIEVDYEVLIDPAIEKQIRQILESYVEEYREKEIIFYGEKEDDNKYSVDKDILDFGNIALPTAKFYSKKENKRVKLLYAIAELGDVREVPLLQGMLDQEDNESISILIKEIILGFLSERSLNKIQEIEAPEIGHLGEHYVYNYLFQAIDTESQYLLLDEVHKIGGEEELNFLRTLSGHPNESIREKARSILDQLEQQKLWPSQEEGIAAKIEATKRNGIHLIKKAGICLIQQIGEKLRSNFHKMGPRLSSIKMHLPHFLLSRSRNGQEKHKILESSVLSDRTVSNVEAENEILHIDFEWDISDIVDRNAMEGKNKTHRAGLFQQLKRSIHPILAKLGNTIDRLKI